MRQLLFNDFHNLRAQDFVAAIGVRRPHTFRVAGNANLSNLGEKTQNLQAKLHRNDGRGSFSEEDTSQFHRPFREARSSGMCIVVEYIVTRAEPWQASPALCAADRFHAVTICWSHQNRNSAPNFPQPDFGPAIVSECAVTRSKSALVLVADF